jgi:hypothetical protein
MSDYNVDRVGRQHEMITVCDVELKNYELGTAAFGANNHLMLWDV